MAKPYVVRLTRTAKTDLLRVAEWYAQRHPRGHERFVKDFARAAKVLATFPEAGRPRTEIANSRSWPVHPFVAFYSVDDERRTVFVERVIHGALDSDQDNDETLINDAE
jgi:plasmid stabilization system protein ParE